MTKEIMQATLIILLTIFFSGFVSCDSHKSRPPQKEEILLPITTETEPSSAETVSAPATVSFIVDVSGSMQPYGSAKVAALSNPPLIDYIAERLVTVWAPKQVVQRKGATHRYRVAKAYRVGADIVESDLNSYHFPVGTPVGISGASSLELAMGKVSEALNPAKPTASMAILVSDLETYIKVPRQCPPKNSPYCVAELLRMLYNHSGPKPGWWIIGLNLHLQNGKATVRRPLFISIWGYDVAQTRSMILDIVGDFKGVLPKQQVEDMHILELYPADWWKPVMTGAWNVKGKIIYDVQKPLNWLPRDMMFTCGSFQKGILDFKVQRYNDKREETFETLFSQKIDMEVSAANTTLKGVSFERHPDTDPEWIDFQVLMPDNAIKGSYRQPDTLAITLVASPRMDMNKLGWITNWSQLIKNFDRFVDGATQVTGTVGNKSVSKPINLRFRKK